MPVANVWILSADGKKQSKIVCERGGGVRREFGRGKE